MPTAAPVEIPDDDADALGFGTRTPPDVTAVPSAFAPANDAESNAFKSRTTAEVRTAGLVNTEAPISDARAGVPTIISNDNATVEDPESVVERIEIEVAGTPRAPAMEESKAARTCGELICCSVTPDITNETSTRPSNSVSPPSTTLVMEVDGDAHAVRDKVAAGLSVAAVDALGEPADDGEPVAVPDVDAVSVEVTDPVSDADIDGLAVQFALTVALAERVAELEIDDDVVGVNVAATLTVRDTLTVAIGDALTDFVDVRVAVPVVEAPRDAVRDGVTVAAVDEEGVALAESKEEGVALGVAIDEDVALLVDDGRGEALVVGEAEGVTVTVARDEDVALLVGDGGREALVVGEADDVAVLDGDGGTEALVVGEAEGVTATVPVAEEVAVTVAAGVLDALTVGEGEKLGLVVGEGETLALIVGDIDGDAVALNVGLTVAATELVAEMDEEIDTEGVRDFDAAELGDAVWLRLNVTVTVEERDAAEDGETVGNAEGDNDGDMLGDMDADLLAEAVGETDDVGDRLIVAEGLGDVLGVGEVDGVGGIYTTGGSDHCNPPPSVPFDNVCESCWTAAELLPPLASWVKLPTIASTKGIPVLLDVEFGSMLESELGKIGTVMVVSTSVPLLFANRRPWSPLNIIEIWPAIRIGAPWRLVA
jgi:hypothetical protein